MPGRQTSEAYDLVFTDDAEPEGYQTIGVMLARPGGRQVMSIEELFEPTEVGSVSPPRPVPVVWDEWRGGAGLAKPVEGVRGAYTIARNACTRFGSVTPAGGLHEYALPSGTPGILGFAALGSDIVILTGGPSPLLLRNYGLGPVDPGTTLAAGSVCYDATMFRGALYIATGTQDLVKFDGVNWQQGATAQLGRGRMATVNWTRQGSSRRRIVATNTSGTAFRYTTGDDPLNPAHWSAEVAVESAWPLQQLVAAPRHVYGIGPGGVFDLTEDGETPCITGNLWADNYDPSNGAAGILYDGGLYVATTTGTWRVRLDGQLVDVMEDVSIGHLQPGEIPVSGRPRAYAVIDGWLAQLSYTIQTATSQLWYGMRRERSGAPVPWPMIWHGSECDLVNQDVSAIHVASPPNAQRRLILATRDLQTGATRLWWHDLPKYGSPIGDYLYGQAADRMGYARDWSITFTQERLADPGSTKDPLWWDVLGRYLGGPNTLTVSAAGRDGASVEQGTASTDDVRIGASGVRDKAITVSVAGQNSESVPAVLDALKGSWVVTVDESATIAVPVIFGRGVSLLNGAEDGQDADLTFTLLSRLTQRKSVELVRWNGERLRVRVEQGIRKRWQESPDGQGWLEGAVLVLTVLSRPMMHDLGDLHDIGLRHDG